MDINKLIQLKIKNSEDRTSILQFVKSNCFNESLTPLTLGMLFELYAEMKPIETDPTTYFSKAVLISELKNIHKDFVTTNGCQWARSDNSYLGKKYIIKRELKSNKVFSVKLDGQNRNSLKTYREINKEIIKFVKSKNCVVLDIHSNIEVDHKNGKYNELNNQNINDQKLADFQPLSKAVNDAKRIHCNRCIKTGKRYDAKHLGYKDGWIVGDENTSTCDGCYWHDPKRFNELISKDYKKEK